MPRLATWSLVSEKAPESERKGARPPCRHGRVPWLPQYGSPSQVAQDKAPGRERQLAPPSPLLNGSESTVFSQSLGLGLELQSQD